MDVVFNEGDFVELKCGVIGDIITVFDKDNFDMEDVPNDTLYYSVNRKDVLRKIYDFETHKDVNEFV